MAIWVLKNFRGTNPLTGEATSNATGGGAFIIQFIMAANQIELGA